MQPAATIEHGGPELELIDSPNEAVRGSQKRTWEQREEDYLLIARLLFEKKSHGEIAKHISSVRPYQLTRRQVSYDIKELDHRFRDKNLTAIKTLKARELDFLSWLEKEAFDAWTKSKADVEKIKQVGVIDANGNKTGEIEVTKIREGSSGNPAFLAILVRTSEARAKLTGIIAPVKIEAEVTTEDAQPIERLREAYKQRITVDIAKHLKLLPPAPPPQEKPPIDVVVEEKPKEDQPELFAPGAKPDDNHPELFDPQPYQFKDLGAEI